MKYIKTFEQFINEKYDNVNEDSAGIIELLKDLKVKNSKGKTITLKKGTRGRHKRDGGWGPDYFVYQGEEIPMEYKGKDQFPQDLIDIII